MVVSYYVYIVGDLFYGIYIVATSGTYGAILYDTLHEEGRSKDYSQINGRVYGLFLAGAGIGNIASGFIANYMSFNAAFFLSIIPCILNLLVILSLHEPNFHRSKKVAKPFKQLTIAVKTISKLYLIRVLTIVMTILTVSELFKLEFGQLYFSRYIYTPQIIGILWAVYAFAMSFGSIIAHKYKSKLSSLIFLASAPYFLMSFIDNRLSILLFMVQVVAASALINLIETEIQDSTTSEVRASVLSVISTLGRIVSIPTALLLGWLIRDFGSLAAVRFIAIVLACMIGYWLYSSNKSKLIHLEIRANNDYEDTKNIQH